MSDQQTTLQANQTVLGYVLKERIGVGGYGEVWSVEAPGGMMKAAKFIFGFHDEQRAQRELKALDRIKHIRHPFLLSLERIDVVDGRMVVITELAEMCMKVRFNKCLENGLQGIDRDELLSHVRESADALDYIADSFSLAHLDIKPENILLVGGHAKVADFGLVKDLQAVNQSLMDGLTPAYAAPELFDGQPGRASDQYSLAIVYHEMLTGNRPFSGTTAAQLANQHLHSRPNLNDLPRSDQPVVARALSKQASKRFPDCRSFVEELGKRRNRVRRKSSTSSTSGNSGSAGVTRTHVDSVPSKPDVTMTISESFIPAIKYEGRVKKLDPFPLDESRAEVRPTLIIGVGQTGAKILCDYRRRLSARIGSADEMPSIRLLALDVDRRSLFEATMGEEHGNLQASETLNIPLRKPEEYRNSQLDVSWIGRRWIYNIPKSQLTESLRPLGRLAFVDHHEAIYRKISDELTKAAAEENLAKTADATSLLPSSASPQVIFVGSVAGGLGSGMLLDIAYSTRVCMAELGFVDDHLFGLLSHSTSRNGGDHRLAIANSFSFLNEMYHYNLNGYPGNEACDIPAFDDQTPVFDGTYFVHFGDDIRPEEYDASTDGIAEYLFTSTVTRARSFFDRCRDTEEFEAGIVQTLGISFVCQGQNDLSDVASDALTQKLLESWLEKANDTDHVSTMANSVFDQTVLLPERLESRIHGLIQEHLGDDPHACLMEQVKAGLQTPQLSTPSLIQFVDQLLNNLLGVPGADIMPGGPVLRKKSPRICDLVVSRLPSIARKTGEHISESVSRLIDDPDLRLSGSRDAANLIIERMQVEETRLERLREDNLQRYKSTETRLVEALSGKSSPDPRALSLQFVEEMVADRLRYVIEACKRILVSMARNEFSLTVNRISEFRQSFRLLQNRLRLPTNVDDIYISPEEEKTLYQLFVDYASDQACQHVPELNQKLERNILKPEGGLRSILEENGNRSRLLPARIKQEAQLVVSNQLQELRLDSMIVDSGLSADTFASWINSLIKPATPMLYKCGGTARLLIAVPKNAPVATIASYIQNLMDHEANIVPSTYGDFIVCMEMDRMPAENVAMTILQMQPDCTELIERLHSRTDVDWSSLTPMC